MNSTERHAFRVTLLASMCLIGAHASAQVIKKVLVDVSPACTDPFKFQDGVCKADVAVVAALKGDQCKAPGLALIGTQCHVIENQPPVPKCPTTEPPSSFDKTLKQCVVTDDRIRSSLGNYVGDCFRIRALPEPSPVSALRSGETYMVVSQRPEGDTDKLLRMSQTDGGGMANCRSRVGGLEFDAKASDLIAIGADRAGWTYGVLALPYKFHTDDRSFGSGVSIGPYFGRRWGVPGSAYTFAVAATIGTVKGEIRDAQDKITSTPDLQAFSLAMGWMYDIAKGADTRPFKIGLFFGADVVGADNVVKYKHNRKPWVAFQIGFDFTDN